MQKLTRRTIRRRIKRYQKFAIGNGIDGEILQQYSSILQRNHDSETKRTQRRLVLSAVTIFLLSTISLSSINSFWCARCLLPNNYLIWEATRPVANCSYCRNMAKPIILRNVTQHSFANYAYSSKPIIVKGAIKHWRAAKELNYTVFKQLYEHTQGSYESIDEGCQFLNFKTDLFTLKEVFNMPESRVNNEPGEKPWYVGWGNCHPIILAKVRQYYSAPEFLPDDAEFPGTENIFFGYEIGAVMHLDYISRLMWQGQVRGNKTWSIAPVPECDHTCNKFEFYVEPGDVVLLDTRLWYHSTQIPKGQFSLTVQSEYG